MSDRPALHPDFTTPAELAEWLGVSQRTLREKAASVGAGRRFGKRTILLEDDVAAIMEATKQCPSSSSGAVRSGTTEVPLPEGDFEALQKRLTGKSRNGSRRKPKIERGSVVSMGRERG